MSDIDLFEHEYLAHLGYLPIYRPTQIIDGKDWGIEFESKVTPDNLILGGGIGEHPALIVRNLTGLAAFFLLNQFTDEDIGRLGNESYDYLYDLDAIRGRNAFEFIHWEIEHYSSFHNMAQAPTFHTPSSGQDIELWLAASLGEFIYYSLPTLVPEFSIISSMVKDMDIRPTMRNVMCPAPGTPKKYGRKSSEENWHSNYRWSIEP